MEEDRSENHSLVQPGSDNEAGRRDAGGCVSVLARIRLDSFSFHLFRLFRIRLVGVLIS